MNERRSSQFKDSLSGLPNIPSMAGSWEYSAWKKEEAGSQKQVNRRATTAHNGPCWALFYIPVSGSKLGVSALSILSIMAGVKLVQQPVWPHHKHVGWKAAPAWFFSGSYGDTVTMTHLDSSAWAATTSGLQIYSQQDGMAAGGAGGGSGGRKGIERASGQVGGGQ